MLMDAMCLIIGHKWERTNPMYCNRCKRIIGHYEHPTLPEWIKNIYNGFLNLFRK